MSGISNLLGKVFGTDKALTASVEAVKNGLDKLVYTDEEKADGAAKARTEARSMIIKWMEATQGQNLARRCLAFLIAGIYAFHHFAGTVVGVAAVWTPNPDKWLATAEVFKNSGDSVGTATMLILTFYFAAPHMGDVIKVISEKFTTK